MTRPYVAVELLAVVAVLSACGLRSETPPRAHARAAAASGTLPPAGAFAPEEAVVDSFLAISIETAPADPSRYDALQACSPETDAPRTLWLADYRVLSAERVNDTVVVAAEVTSVAEQGESDSVADRFVVRPAIRVDTLHWAVIRRPDGRRALCGFAHEDVELGGYGRPDNTDYLDGATRESLLRRVDSIQRAP